MRDVIVHNEIDVEFARYGSLYLVKERAELGGALAPVAPHDDPSGRNIDGGEQRCGAMPFVVMAPSGRSAGTHRQHRPAAVQGLDLQLLIHTRNDGVLRRGDVEANDIAHFGHEVRIGRELEGLHLVRLKPEGPPDALYHTDRKLAVAMSWELQ